MEYLYFKNADEVSDRAAETVLEVLREKSDAVLGLSTGSTPLGLYERLIRAYQEGRADFSKVRSFNLDEYVGLSPEHENSYGYYMRHHLFSHINIAEENAHVPSGTEKDYAAYCREYERKIESVGGMDLMILGVGENGHIAFNEPDEKLSVHTHVVDLTEDTIAVNSRFFRSVEEVPKRAVTMGIGTILRSKKILLLATGVKKSPVLRRLLREPYFSTEFPVSFLFGHRDVTILADEGARGGM